MTGSPGIAIGNVIGSNIANILFVIGVTAFFATLVGMRGEVLRDVVVMMLATGWMMYLMASGEISQIAGFNMIAVLLVYVIWQYWMAAKGKLNYEEPEIPEYPTMWMAVLFLGMGLASIAFGAEFLVRGAKTAASIIGVPEDVIGLSVIAVGTSLPELS
ncbi:MAG: hypothetical protein CUN56_15265, partial [Phototrophicales bacterium]